LIFRRWLPPPLIFRLAYAAFSFRQLISCRFQAEPAAITLAIITAAADADYCQYAIELTFSR
jgi:hypothetical protein